MNKIAKVLAASVLGAAILSIGAAVEAAPDTTTVSSVVVSDSGFSAGPGVKSVTWTTHFNPNWIHNDVTGVNGGAAFTRNIQVFCSLSGVVTPVTVENRNGSNVLDDNYFLQCSAGSLVGGQATLSAF